LFFRRMRNNGAAPYKSKRGATLAHVSVSPEKLGKPAVYIQSVSAHARHST